MDRKSKSLKIKAARTRKYHSSTGDNEMVDRVYKTDLPRLKNALVEMRGKFSNLDIKTDWTNLRIEPLLKHIESLEHVMNSPEFSQELLRLRIGVGMFHSDLVYLRENVRGLERVLQFEKNRYG